MTNKEVKPTALQQFYADRVIEFLAKYAPYVFERAKKPIIKQLILKHLEYNTIVILWNSGEIIGVCAFNIKDKAADIVDCVVHPNYRFKQTLKKMTEIGFAHYPYVEKLTYERWEKFGNMDKHVIDLSKWLAK